MVKHKLGFLAAGLVIFSLTATKAFAGGWPIYIYSWENGDAWKPDYKMIYTRAHLAPNVPCKGTTVTFKYDDSQPGDNVSAGGDNGSFTFNEDMYKSVNGKQVADCNTYAKYYSTNNTLKHAVVEFKTADGKTYNAKFALNFQLSSPVNTSPEEKWPLPWEEERSEGVYTINKKPAATTTPAEGWGNGNLGPGRRVSSTSTYPKATKIPETTAVPSVENSNLQNKIDDLQRKLEESQRKQSALEQQLNSIISWLKSVFPFFK